MKIKDILAKFAFALPLILTPPALSEEGHDHDQDHEEEEEHVEVDPTTVGPEKGVTEKSEFGFKLAPEAEQSFRAQKIKVSTGVIEVPAAAIVRIKSEKSVYRVRDGWIKRVSVEVSNKDKNKPQVKSADLKPNDEILTSEVGFIRMTEVFIEGGASHGHSH